MTGFCSTLICWALKDKGCCASALDATLAKHSESAGVLLVKQSSGVEGTASTLTSKQLCVLKQTTKKLPKDKGVRQHSLMLSSRCSKLSLSCSLGSYWLTVLVDSCSAWAANKALWILGVNENWTQLQVLGMRQLISSRVSQSRDVHPAQAAKLASKQVDSSVVPIYLYWSPGLYYRTAFKCCRFNN